MSFDLPQMRAAVAEHAVIVRVLIAETRGSSPRGPGTAMLVWAEGQAGSIGGGALEHQATQRARAMLRGEAGAEMAEIPLGPGLGQCCGGAVRLIWERFTEANLPRTLPFARRIAADALATPPESGPRAGPGPLWRAGWLIEGAPAPGHPIWIWGAGHVGRALVALLAPLPDLALSWIDFNRGCFPEEIPAGVEVIPADRPERLIAHAPKGADHLIMTRSHDLDFALCAGLLQHGVGQLGLIGSATKAARFRKRLASAGCDPTALICPIGDPKLGRHPQQIAIGIAAALLPLRAGRATKGQDD